MSYNDLMESPYESVEWLERRRVQELIDRQQAKGQ